MDIIEILNLAKYLVWGLGGIGVIVLIIGLYSTNRDMIQRGAMLVIAAVIMLVCGYFITQATVKRASQYIIKEYYDY